MCVVVWDACIRIQDSCHGGQTDGATTSLDGAECFCWGKVVLFLRVFSPPSSSLSTTTSHPLLPSFSPLLSLLPFCPVPLPPLLPFVPSPLSALYAGWIYTQSSYCSSLIWMWNKCCDRLTLGRSPYPLSESWIILPEWAADTRILRGRERVTEIGGAGLIWIQPTFLSVY